MTAKTKKHEHLRREVWLSAKKIDPNDPLPAAVLLASVHIGLNADEIASFLGSFRDPVRVIARRLRQNGIWKNGVIHHSGWLDPEEGNIAFMLDVLVAQGLLERDDGPE